MSDTFYVVCDANGLCHGVFIDENTANKVCDFVAGYVSKETVIRNYEEYCHHRDDMNKKLYGG